MDTKRLIIAIALSLVVIIAYQYFFVPKRAPQKPPQDTLQTGQGQAVSGETAEAKKSPFPGTDSTPDEIPDIFSTKKKEKTPVEDKKLLEAVSEQIKGEMTKDVTIETDLFKATFTNKGAGLKSFILKKYNDDKKQPLELISMKVHEKFGPYAIFPFYLSPFDEDNREMFLDINTQNFKYDGEVSVNLSQSQTRQIVFRYADPAKNISVTRRFFISGSSYVLSMEQQIVKDGQIIDAPFVFGPDLENNVSKNRVMQSGLRVGAYDGDDVKEKVLSRVSTEKVGEGIEQGTGSMAGTYWWASYDTNYFGVLFKQPRNIGYAVLKVQGAADEKNDKELYSYIIITSRKPIDIYLGPKDERDLGTLEKQYGFRDATQVVSYGWAIFGSIARIMLKGILLIHGLVPNYGWALIIFTIFVKILLFPLTYASSVSMARMQTIQPKMQVIKKKYKNQKDPEQRRKMNAEMMDLYKREKVNPAGGCLPMLLQMPILIAFFRLLPISINFRHEPWMLWISDLSVKDPIYLLPILMGATQLIVSKMSPTTAESSQKKIMYIMPVVMVFLFLSYSAGLNLYWFIANLLQIAQQYFINKKIYHKKREEDKLRRVLKRKKGGKTK